LLDDFRIRALHQRLHAYRPRAAEVAVGAVAASVALVVRPASTDLELLLIRRAVAPGDPWSGHMALPGGRRAPEDPDAAATAVRETHEEVGIDLHRVGFLLGRLDPVAPRGAPARVHVSPFVFAVPSGTRTEINYEVDAAVWAPIRRLTEPNAATEHLHPLASGEHLRFPAIGYQEYVIWGLTHRILTQFLQLTRSNPQQGARSE
jgi:8-oxo-dGTP pyrophosphatase MutT (NUDIX family)